MLGITTTNARVGGYRGGNRGGSVGGSLYSAYQARVAADSGNIDESQDNLVSLLNQLNGVVSNFSTTCKLATAPHWGNKAATGTGGTAGNRAANKLYNIFGASGDLVQATAASQPLLLRNTGTNYVYLSGINGNYFTSPFAVSNQFRNDVDYAICVRPSTLSVAQGLMGRTTTVSGNRGFSFDITNTGILRFLMRFAADVAVSSTVTLGSVGVSINNPVWLRVTRNATNQLAIIQAPAPAALPEPPASAEVCKQHQHNQ
jgi:hypothetical protein